MRAFIAIELPQEIKDSLRLAQDKLKTRGDGITWVKPENMHLTLKFLGEIDDKKLASVIRILEETAGGRGPFFIRLSSFGAFPALKFPRVIWAGITEGDTQAREIAETLEKKIAGIGIPAEKKPFSSHITIGRLKSALNRQGLIEELSRLTNDLAKGQDNFLIDKVMLLKSTLTPKGPVYEPIKEVKLKPS